MEKKLCDIYEIDNLLRFLCDAELDVCKDIHIDMDTIAEGIDIGIAYAKLQLELLVDKDKLDATDDQGIFDNFSNISKKIASVARAMIQLGGGDRLHEIGLQIVQHNLLSPLVAMTVTSKMISDKSALVH